MRYESYVAIISEKASYSKIATVCMKISNFCLTYLMQNAIIIRKFVQYCCFFRLGRSPEWSLIVKNM